MAAIPMPTPTRIATPARIAAPLGRVPLLTVPDAVGKMRMEAVLEAGLKVGLEAEVEVVGTFWGIEAEEELPAVLEGLVKSMVVRIVPTPRVNT
jgi:hypothetical protein